MVTPMAALSALMIRSIAGATWRCQGGADLSHPAAGERQVQRLVEVMQGRRLGVQDSTQHPSCVCATKPASASGRICSSTTVVATPSSAASAGVDWGSPRRCARASDAINGEAEAEPNTAGGDRPDPLVDPPVRQRRCDYGAEQHRHPRDVHPQQKNRDDRERPVNRLVKGRDADIDGKPDLQDLDRNRRDDRAERAVSPAHRTVRDEAIEQGEGNEFEESAEPRAQHRAASCSRTTPPPPGQNRLGAPRARNKSTATS